MDRHRIPISPYKGTPPPPARPRRREADVFIDGAQGEGGGQVVRASLALSAVRARSVVIHSIRHNRPNPGLQMQHVISARLVSEIASSPIRNDERDAEWVSLARPEHPEEPLGIDRMPLQAVVTTAGSTALVLQAALPAALKHLPSVSEAADTTLVITGGTAALNAPTNDYVAHVLVPNLSHFGITVTYKLQRHGFFPMGKGRIAVSLSKANTVPFGNDKCLLKAPELVERGKVLTIHGKVLVAGSNFVSAGLGNIIREAAAKVVRTFTRKNQGYPYFDVDCISVQEVLPGEASGRCACITLYATTECGTVLGASGLMKEEKKKNPKARRYNAYRGIPYRPENQENGMRSAAAKAGEDAAEELCQVFESQAAVDVHMADQMCVFMAMAKGVSKVSVPPPSLHLETVVKICNEFNVNIQLETSPGPNPCLLTCVGMEIPLPR